MKNWIASYMESTLVITKQHRKLGALNVKILKQIEKPLQLTSG